MARTTVILEENLMLEVKQLARAKQTTATQIIHEALTAYVEAVKTGLTGPAIDGSNHRARLSFH